MLFSASTAFADPQYGLQAVGYTFPSSGIPTRSDALYETCGSELENNINRNFNGEPFQECGHDFFMIHYTGFITIPENETISFMIAADDGGTVQIGDTLFGTWNNKGCSWSATTSALFPAGSYPLDGWFYEWGGSTCFMLAWNVNNTGWQIVPDDAFTLNDSVSTTTTTTVPETTTTTTSTTTTTVASSTTTTTTTTTTVYVPVGTTTTEPEETTTTTTEPQEETTTTVFVAETTLPMPEPVQTTLPEEQEETESTTTSTISQEVDEEQGQESLPEESDLPQETEETEELPSDDTIVEKVLSDEEFEEFAETLQNPDATVLEVQGVIDQFLQFSPTQEQVLEVVSNPLVLQAISFEQAEELFADLDVGEISVEEGGAIVNAVQTAPQEVRVAFQETVNVFAGVFDEYVAVGSSVPVRTRRLIIAATAAMFLLPAPVPMMRQPK